jgi:ABC-type lipoprotein release transport system permease subunit
VLALLTVSWLRDRFLARAVSPVSVSMMVMLLILALVLAATVGPALQARKTAPAALLRED